MTDADPGALRAHLPRLGAQLPESIMSGLLHGAHQTQPITIVNLTGQVGASHAFNLTPQISVISKTIQNIWMLRRNLQSSVFDRIAHTPSATPDPCGTVGHGHMVYTKCLRRLHETKYKIYHLNIRL